VEPPVADVLPPAPLAPVPTPPWPPAAVLLLPSRSSFVSTPWLRELPVV
jgi:hypothetical protein